MSDTNLRGNNPAGIPRGNDASFGIPEKEKLNKFTLISIYMLAVMGLASGLMLLFGEFEGKFIRVFATLFLFVVFTAAVAYDTSSNKPFFALPIALAGNIYLLALSLMMIWASLGKSSFDSYAIFPKLIGLIIAVRVAVWAIQKMSYLVAAEQEQLALSAKITVGALAITAFLYTIPLALDHLLDFHDFYWKLAVFSIIVSGISMSISSLLFWTFKNKLNPIIAAEFGSMAAISEPKGYVAPQNNAPKYGGNQQQPNNSFTFPATTVRPVAYEERNTQQNAPVAPKAPAAEETTPAHRETVQAPPAPAKPPAATVPAVPAAPQYAQPQPAPLPWPVFPDGTPLPATPEGAPDFRALDAYYQRSRGQWNQQ